MDRFDQPAPYVATARHAQEAHELLEKVLDLEMDDQKNALKEGMYLFRMREIKSWEQLGYDSEIALFSANNMDVRSTQYKRRATVWYRVYGLDPNEYIRIGYTKLAYLAAHANEQNFQEVLDNYGHMSYRDMKKSLDPLDDRAPEGFRRITCPNCGFHFEHKVPLQAKPHQAANAITIEDRKAREQE